MPSKSANLDDPVVAPPIRSVAIIGGGASGAISLDSLVSQNCFSQIVLFERRSCFGGVWVLDESPRVLNKHIGAGAGASDLDPPLKNPFKGNTKDLSIVLPKSTQERFEQTPAYKGMATNIIEHMMTFSDRKSWKEGEENKYVESTAVRDYIDAYIERNRTHASVKVVTNTTVEDVERNDGFKLTLRHLTEQQDEWYQQQFDAIVVASGHYHVPYIPQIEGLLEVQALPNVVHHAKFFRSAHQYENKRLVVVGSRASGADLTKYSSDVATTVYQLIRNIANTKRFSKRANVFVKPEISSVSVKDGVTVTFADGSLVSQIDHIVFATGFQFSYPYLKGAFGEITDGNIVPGLYQHTFFSGDPAVAFVGVPIDGISFRVFEYQAVLVSRYFAGMVTLPSIREQDEWSRSRLMSKGSTRAYHTIGAIDALSFLKTLVDLGEAKGNKGRNFPSITESDVEEYKAAAAKLTELWDQPRV